MSAPAALLDALLGRDRRWTRGRCGDRASAQRWLVDPVVTRAVKKVNARLAPGDPRHP